MFCKNDYTIFLLKYMDHLLMDKEINHTKEHVAVLDGNCKCYIDLLLLCGNSRRDLTMMFILFGMCLNILLTMEYYIWYYVINVVNTVVLLILCILYMFVVMCIVVVNIMLPTLLWILCFLLLWILWYSPLTILYIFTVMCYNLTFIRFIYRSSENWICFLFIPMMCTNVHLCFMNFMFLLSS